MGADGRGAAVRAAAVAGERAVVEGWRAVAACVVAFGSLPEFACSVVGNRPSDVAAAFSAVLTAEAGGLTSGRVGSACLRGQALVAAVGVSVAGLAYDGLGFSAVGSSGAVGAA